MHNHRKFVTVLSIALVFSLAVIGGTALAEEADQAHKNLFELYGEVRVSVDNNSGSLSKNKGISLVDNSSLVGVKGSVATSLPKTSLIYKAGIKYNATDELTFAFKFYEAFAGFESPLGVLKLGRPLVAYKKSVTRIDPWSDNAPESRGAKGVQGSSALHGSFFNNTVSYETPLLFGRFVASGWYSSQFDDSTKPLHNTDPFKNYEGGTTRGAGIKYEETLGPVNVLLAADLVDLNADTVKDAGMHNDSGWQVAGRARIQNFSVAGLYEDLKDIGAGRNRYVNAVYSIKNPALSLIAAYGNNTDATSVTLGGNAENGTNAPSSDTWSVGAKYLITKKSELFAAYKNRRMDTKRENTVTAGVNVFF